MKIWRMVKRFFSRKDVKGGIKQVLSITAVLSMLCIMAFAVDSTPDISTAFTTGFQKIVADSIALLSAMLPIAISLAGTLFLIKKAMAWFKQVSNG